MNLQPTWSLLALVILLLPMALPTMQNIDSTADVNKRRGKHRHGRDGSGGHKHKSRPASSSPNSRVRMSKDDNDGGGGAKQTESLGKVLRQLIKEKARPTTEQWQLFRHVCRSSRHQVECESIFAYFRKILLPFTFPGPVHHEQCWGEMGLIGLAKREDVSHTKTSTTSRVTHQFGDDSCVLGGDYLIVSDGVTRNPVSNFFSRQVVEFLNAGMQRLGRQRRKEDPADQIFELISSLEDLILAVQLPAAATLSLVYLSSDRRYIYVSTLGDSEVKVARKGEVIYSSPLQRTRNVPGQLNARRRAVADQMTLDRVRVREGDWIIVASDGLWDNVLEEEMVVLLKDSAKSSLTRLMKKALGRKGITRPVCTYDAQVKRERCVGGREDDISIAITRV